MQTGGPHAVMELLDRAHTSAAVGAALELGLFWLIDERALPAAEIVRQLGLRPEPSVYWLQLLRQAGFVEEGPDGYRSSPLARTAIVRAYARLDIGHAPRLRAKDAQQRPRVVCSRPYLDVIRLP